MSATKKNKADPFTIETYKRGVNPYRHIKTLRDICRLKDLDVPTPLTSQDFMATRFSYFAPVVSRILAETIREFEADNGSLNARSTVRRRHSDVVQALDDTEIRKIAVLCDCLREHMCEQFYSLARPPPDAGGDTARWSTAAQMYTLVCQMTYVLVRFGYNRKEYEAYNPSESAYLTANALVVDDCELRRYSVRAVQMSVHTLLERLYAITSYHPHLDLYVRYLCYRIAELIVGAGDENTYNAPEWCSTMANAHNSSRVVTEAGDDRLLTCTTDFVTHSMCWTMTLRSFLSNYNQTAPPPLDQPLAHPSADRYSVEQTRTFRWYPTARMTFLAYEFFCKYAAHCVDDTYMHGVRDYCMQFEMSPDHPAIYRVLNNTEKAVPADVLATPMPNMSPVGKEFVRLIKYGMPLLEWMHRFWNWRKGETRIRSAYMGSNLFYTQLAVLYVIDLYFSNKLRINFRHRFVMYHNDPAFAFLCEKAKRNGFPFIVQQFGYWCVYVPHRANPETGTFPANTTLEARAEAAAQRTQAEEVAAAAAAADEDSSDGESRAFDEDYSWQREREAANQADQRGDDISLDRPAMKASRVPKTTHNEDYARVYDCETILDAYNVWSIAMLHLKSGMIDKKDISRMICDMYQWPHPRDEDEESQAD